MDAHNEMKGHRPWFQKDLGLNLSSIANMVLTLLDNSLLTSRHGWFNSGAYLVDFIKNDCEGSQDYACHIVI